MSAAETEGLVGRTVGFVGLGAMGAPMATNLAAAGARVLLHDSDSARISEVAASSGGWAAGLDALAAGADTIITMLPSSDVVEAVLCGRGGVLEHLRHGPLVIDMSSSDPIRTRALSEIVTSAGARFVDAPVSGGVPRALTADLAIMVGGDPRDVAVAEPVLAAMGSSVTHTGDVGSAHAMKALNNLCSAGGFLIGIEVLLVGRAFGLDPALMVDVLNGSTGMNNSTLRKFKQFVLSGEYSSSFGLDLLLKDLGIALRVADRAGVGVPFAETCLAQWTAAREELGAGRDHTEMARHCETVAGVVLA